MALTGKIVPYLRYSTRYVLGTVLGTGDAGLAISRCTPLSALGPGMPSATAANHMAVTYQQHASVLIATKDQATGVHTARHQASGMLKRGEGGRRGRRVRGRARRRWIEACRIPAQSSRVQASRRTIKNCHKSTQTSRPRQVDQDTRHILQEPQRDNNQYY